MVALALFHDTEARSDLQANAAQRRVAVNFSLVKINVCLIVPQVGRIFSQTKQPGRVFSLMRRRIAATTDGFRVASSPSPTEAGGSRPLLFQCGRKNCLADFADQPPLISSHP